MRAPCLTLGASLLWMLTTGPARADADTGQKAAAQMLFEQGRELVEQSHFSEACPKFAESLKLDRGLGTMLWLADCLESNGQTASAWATFTEATDLAGATHDKRAPIARDRAARLASRLSKLTILVPEAVAGQGLVVERDGIALGATQWGLAVPVDPGVHTIAASAPGRVAWSTTVRLTSNPDTLMVTIPLLAAAAPAPAATGVPAPRAAVVSGPLPHPPGSPPDPAATDHPGSTQRMLAWGLAGLGVVGLGAGTYLSFAAKSTYDGSASGGHCQANDVCDATGKQQRGDAFSQATAATIALGAGAVAVLGGAVLYFTAGPRSPPLAAGVAPGVGGGSAWVSLRW